MNCEHVRELLSAYLDNELAPEERRSVARHLPSCMACSSLLADFRRFDALLSRLPRVEPQRTLEERIFSSTAYRELTGTSGGYAWGKSYAASSRRRLRDDPGRPKLVALPGGLLAETTTQHVPQPPRRRRGLSPFVRVLLLALVVSALLTLGVSGFVGWQLWYRVHSTHAPAFLPVVALRR